MDMAFPRLHGLWMNSKNPVRVAILGGFGHAACVFDELITAVDSHIICAGIAPVIRDESLDGFLGHPWMRGAPVFSCSQQLLQEAPDVLIVSTRPDHIFPMAMEGLQSGCHLILEKPVALSFADLETLEIAAKKAGRRVMAMLSMRSLPSFVEAKRLVASGVLGKVVLVNTCKSYKWGTRPAWFNDPAQYGGTWTWIGIHNLDMSHFVTGLRAKKVLAMHGNFAHPEMPHCEDIAGGIFELEGGARMIASIDLCRPQNAPTHGDDWIRVVGTEGALEANGSTGRISMTASGSEPFDKDCGTDPQSIYLPFLESLPVPDPAADSVAFDLTRSALAARESSKNANWIEIPCGT